MADSRRIVPEIGENVNYNDGVQSRPRLAGRPHLLKLTNEFAKFRIPDLTPFKAPV